MIEEPYDLSVFESRTACEDCVIFEKHGKKCWYYWEHKKDCSQKQ